MTDPINFNLMKAVAEGGDKCKIELGHAVLNAVGMRGARGGGGGHMERRGMHNTHYTTDNKDK